MFLVPVPRLSTPCLGKTCLPHTLLGYLPVGLGHRAPQKSLAWCQKWRSQPWYVSVAGQKLLSFRVISAGFLCALPASPRAPCPTLHPPYTFWSSQLFSTWDLLHAQIKLARREMERFALCKFVCLCEIHLSEVGDCVWFLQFLQGHCLLTLF